MLLPEEDISPVPLLGDLPLLPKRDELIVFNNSPRCQESSRTRLLPYINRWLAREVNYTEYCNRLVPIAMVVIGDELRVASSPLELGIIRGP